MKYTYIINTLVVVLAIKLTIKLIRYCIEYYIKEPFTSKSAHDYLQLQAIMNPQLKFDVNQIQQYTSQSEMDYFIQHSKWQWSQKTIDLYLHAIKLNPYIRTSPEDSLNRMQTEYSEGAILRILSYNSPEGAYLLKNCKNTMNTNGENAYLSDDLNNNCDPCVALNLKPDYSCPFQVPNNNKNTTDIWQYLWNQ